MPRARTRLTLQGPTGAMFEKPEEGFDNFDPANSTPLFAYLCSEEGQNITGQAFIVWGREIKVLKRQEMEATFHRKIEEKVSELRGEGGAELEAAHRQIEELTEELTTLKFKHQGDVDQLGMVKGLLNAAEARAKQFEVR